MIQHVARAARAVRVERPHAGKANQQWYVDFVARWYGPLLGAVPAGATGIPRPTCVDRAFAEVYRLRRRVTTDADRLELVASILGEPIGDGAVGPIVVSAAERAVAEAIAMRLVRRARRRQVVVSAVVAVPVVLIGFIDMLARR